MIGQSLNVVFELEELLVERKVSAVNRAEPLGIQSKNSLYKETETTTDNS